MYIKSPTLFALLSTIHQIVYNLRTSKRDSLSTRENNIFPSVSTSSRFAPTTPRRICEILIIFTSCFNWKEAREGAVSRHGGRFFVYTMINDNRNYPF